MPLRPLIQSIHNSKTHLGFISQVQQGNIQQWDTTRTKLGKSQHLKNEWKMKIFLDD